jgi:exonuclease III
MAYNISSLNCNGIRDVNKRRQLFSWVIDTKFDIIYLQETHSTKNDEISWRQEWGGEIFYAHGTSNSRGVAILFRPQLNINVIKNIRKSDGRLLLLELTVGEKNILLANIYGPNDDNLELFQNICSDITDMECLDMIIGGDFNLVLDTEIDKKGGTRKTHTKSAVYLKNIMQNLNLVDIWRIQHPETKQYTWRRRNPTPIHSRLDMFLVT